MDNKTALRYVQATPEPRGRSKEVKELEAQHTKRLHAVVKADRVLQDISKKLQAAKRKDEANCKAFKKRKARLVWLIHTTQPLTKKILNDIKEFCDI